MKLRHTLAVSILALAAAGAQAQGLDGTLKKIKDTGTITLGVRESSVPFSYYDQNQKTIGYSQDIAMAIVAAIKQQLGLPKLAVKELPITSQNRIPLVQNGTVDLECGSTTNTLERQKQAAFSNSIFLYGIKMVTPKRSGVKDFSDLQGKTVVTTAGTTSERLLRKMLEDKKANFQLVSAKDHGEAFLSVETGRAVAFVMDEPLVYGAKAKARNPDDYVVTGTPLAFENYACMMRRDDPAFKALVDKTVAHLETSGEAAKLYDKWFMQPVPPRGVNLNYPMSQEMKELFAHPNDKAQY